MKLKICAVLLGISLAAATMTGCVKIVKTGEEGVLTGVEAFNAGDAVANFWDSTALPEMEGKAVQLSELLQQAGGDLASKDSEDYAKYSMGASGELTYTVKGTGTIQEVENGKKAGYLLVTLDDYEGTEAIKIQIGTVFKGTSVRDSLNFIDFNDYTNQIEWAEVSQEINTLIQKNVIDPIGYDAFTKGKSIEFLGAFTVSSSDELLITPTKITIK